MSGNDSSKVKIGIVGGTGFYNMPQLKDKSVVEDIRTEFGAPSSNVVTGRIDGVECALILRHGPGHQYSPTEVNYRANMLALKDLGVTHILAATACGSLKEELPPGHFVVLDSFIDRTTKRVQTYHTQELTTPRFGKVSHIPMHPSFCDRTAACLYEAGKELGISISPKGTAVTIEGPRFSSRAESRLFKTWGADVVNMTTVPEVVLAKELGVSYAAVAMVTDYDCWREEEEGAVDVAQVMETMKGNVDKVRDLIVAAVAKIKAQDWTDTLSDNLKTAKVATMHEASPPAMTD